MIDKTVCSTGLSALLIAGCGGGGTTAPPAPVSIKGDVFAFLSEVDGPRVSGATLSILEQPDKTATTGADAHFEIDGLAVGSDATLVLSHPSFFPTQSATYTLGPNGIDPFAFQVLSNSLYNALSGLFPGLEMDTHCVIATTITRLGGTVHVSVRQGEPDATLTITPTMADTKGPVYFGTNALPDMTLLKTTKDGGALFYHVPPGDYVIAASKPGVTFTPERITCRAGYVVNAAPPMGVQASVVAPDWGSSAAPDQYSASTDAMCTRTGACVEAMNGAGSYPAATVAGCQGTFRRVLGFIDPTCDASAHVRDTLKAFFDCRAASCMLTLGDDTACPTEESAYVAAMAAYAPCYTAAHGG
jgi:hypothetical protein